MSLWGRLSYTTVRIKSINLFLLSLIALTFLATILIPLHRLHRSQEEVARSSSSSIIRGIVNASGQLSEQLQARLIAQRARDVARQLSIYFQSHGTRPQIVTSKDVATIAVQPVGQAGYTALFECATNITIAHKNQQLNGKDLKPLQHEFPEWWQIYDRRNDCADASGPYHWRDADGVVRKKFMAISPVVGTGYMVAATTYLEDFLKDKNMMVAMGKRKTDEMQRVLEDELTQVMRDSLMAVSVIMLLLFFLPAVLLGDLQQVFTI
jgi:hypothetical protein